MAAAISSPRLGSGTVETSSTPASTSAAATARPGFLVELEPQADAGRSTHRPAAIRLPQNGAGANVVRLEARVLGDDLVDRLALRE